MDNNETKKEIKAIPDDGVSEDSSVENPDEGSALSDLLHVLGFNRNNQHSASRTNSVDTQNTEIPPTEIEPQENTETREDTIDANSALKLEIPDNAHVEIALAPFIIENPNERTHPTWKITAMVVMVILILGITAYRFLPTLMEPKPPSPDIVGTYNGKNITVDELMDFIAVEGAKEREHMLCPNHGYDHSKCEPTEECEQHPIHTLEGYQEMVTRLAVEQMVLDWAEAQGITQREDVRHEMEDLLNDATVEQYISQLHDENITVESISKWDVQQYYSENQSQFQGKTLDEAEDEIRQILVEQKDETFFEDYIEELKKTAGLQVDFEVLKTETPAGKDIEAYYNANIEQYRTPETATYSEIRISSANSDSSTEAIRKIRSGEAFNLVAATYSQSGSAQTVTIEKGKGEAAIEARIWKMQAEEISDPITNSDGSVSIIKMISTAPSGYQQLSEVSESIELTLLRQIMDEEYTLRKGDMLFSIHSRRYTLGEFYTEFQELSEIYQEALSTYEEKKQFVEQMIVMELLLEESSDEATSSDSDAHELEELRVQYLWQILHQEEVDNDLDEPTEEEIRTFYEENREMVMTPASAEISLIWIDQGANYEKREQALTKAEEALMMLESGTSFAEVAKIYSEDSSAAEGGAIPGPIYADHLAVELAEPIFSLDVGQVSEIIDYYYGYYIIQVRSRTEAQLPPLEEVSHAISDYLSELAHEEATIQMEQQLLDEAGFTIYDKTLRNILKAQEKTEQ